MVGNDDVNTPFERSSELGGKAEFGDEELAAVLADRAKRNADRAPTIGGETGAGPTHWHEFWNARSVRTSKIIDPPDGRVPPLTAEAQKAVAARAEAAKRRGPSDSWTDRSLGDRCIVSRGGWPHVVVNAGSYGNIIRIIQSPGYVVLTHEMIHETRVIPVDGRPHAGDGIRQYLGDPRGRWEGNTLVVEVTNFSDKTDFRGSRETLRLVERFTRVGPDAINYAVTIDDPKTFTKPWTIGVVQAGQGADGNLRVRMPRGELCDAQHPERRARRRPRAKVAANGIFPVKSGAPPLHDSARFSPASSAPTWLWPCARLSSHRLHAGA